MNRLESYFAPFRRNIIGIDQCFSSAYREQRLVYADWTASGRLYGPIEHRLSHVLGPFVGNTHSESSMTGTTMTQAYHQSHKILKDHVHAGLRDVIMTTGFGMTAAVNKFQRILGLKVPEQLAQYLDLPLEFKPVVFLTHMEHHSNHTTWLETLAEVIVVEPDAEGLVDLNRLYETVKKYRDRPLKMGAFTACSNVTGIGTPYHQMAKIMHSFGGYCFIDFAASAPYVDINMHPEDPEEKLDAIFFSPHKFLGGPGASGVLIFDSELYKLRTPDQPGGGTVNWTNPWGEHRFINDIEIREDGGTPGFLQAMKSAFSVRLKEQMGVANMLAREEEMLRRAFPALRAIPGLHILADHVENRLAIVSFYVDHIHYNLFVRILNDRFGIQVRGGCSCAGTYGHYLLHVDPGRSAGITEKIDRGDFSEKPGWVRVSFHPTTTNDELDFIIRGIRETVAHVDEWAKDYRYSAHTNEFAPVRADNPSDAQPDWFHLDSQ